MTFTQRNLLDLRRCTPMAPADERRCALEYVKTRSPILAERLIAANMRLVVVIARGYRSMNCDLRDVVQEGNLGLIHAVERFDPDRGVRLSSYAAWWIRAYVLKFLMNNWGLVKVGTSQAQRRLFFNLQKARRKLEHQGIEPDAKQLATLLDVKEGDVVTMIERMAGGETSLDAPQRSLDAHPKAIGDSLSASPAWRPDVQIETSDFARTLRSKLQELGATLVGRESDIFRRRLLSEDPITLSALAARFGVTRERVRQLEERLKERIRDYLRRELSDTIEHAAAPARSQARRPAGDAWEATRRSGPRRRVARAFIPWAEPSRAPARAGR